MAVKEKSSRTGKIINLWLPVFAWMGVIFYVSTLPGKDIPAIFAYQDILFHGVIYAILALFFLRALQDTAVAWNPKTVVLATVLFCFAYGVSDEFHQLFVPGRSCSAFDLGVDTVGACIGSLLGRIFSRWLK